MGKADRHSPAFRERTVRLLREHRHEYKYAGYATDCRYDVALGHCHE